MNIQEILATCEQKIKAAAVTPAFKAMKGNDKTNFVNNLGRHLGIGQMSSEEPELFEALLSLVNKQSKPPMPQAQPKQDPTLFGESIEKILKESVTESIPTAKSILRYDDDIVTSTIKELVGEFKNVTLNKIIGDEGGAFFNVELTMDMGEEVRANLEAKRFEIAQKMQEFKAKFTGKLSSKLPIINVKTGSYMMTKNSTDMQFMVTICLSHTNDREWVTGKMRGNGIKESKKKENIAESSASKKHVVEAMPLDKAIADFRAGHSNVEMLETAIKASGRSELELYVLKSLGFKMPPADKTLKSQEKKAAPDEEKLEQDI